MLEQIVDGCAICRLVEQCVDPQIALRDRQIAQIRRLRLTEALRTDLSEFQGQNFKVGAHWVRVTGGRISLFLHSYSRQQVTKLSNLFKLPLV